MKNIKIIEFLNDCNEQFLILQPVGGYSDIYFNLTK